ENSIIAIPETEVSLITAPLQFPTTTPSGASPATPSTPKSVFPRSGKGDIVRCFVADSAKLFCPFEKSAVNNPTPADNRRAGVDYPRRLKEISAGIKALAKELNIPIIVIAQLNRQPELRGNGKEGV